MYRSTVWRTRLDTTTNWAVVTTGIALSVTFSSVQATPLPIVLVSFLLAAFLLFEARRYQYFDIWNTRLRVIESCFYDPILRSGETCTDNGWNEVLADDLSRLRLHIGLLDAVGLAPSAQLRMDFCDPDRELLEQDRSAPDTARVLQRSMGKNGGRPGARAGRLGGRRLLLP